MRGPSVLSFACVVLGVAVCLNGGVAWGERNPDPWILDGSVTDVVSTRDPDPWLPPSVVPGAQVRGVFYWDPELVDIEPNPDIGVYVTSAFYPGWFTWIVGSTNPDPWIVHTGPTGTLTFRLENDQFPLQVPGPMYDLFSVQSSGNVVEETDPDPYIELLGFTLVDTTPHALDGDELVIPHIADFDQTVSLIIRGCGSPGSGGSCLDHDASDDLFEIRAVLTSMEQQRPPAVPVASAWGIGALALVLLVGAKVYFGRRRALAA